LSDEKALAVKYGEAGMTSALMVLGAMWPTDQSALTLREKRAVWGAIVETWATDQA
jgi:hypothetical protein